MITEHEHDEKMSAVPQMYRVVEVAQRLSLSRTKVIELFEYEDGVVVLTSARRGKRSKRTLLIPEAAILRVIEKLKRRNN
jgi:predicted Ser/Thr protein kinase